MWTRGAGDGLRQLPLGSGPARPRREGKERAATRAAGPGPPGDGAAKDRVGSKVQPARDSQPRLRPESLAARGGGHGEAGTPPRGRGAARPRRKLVTKQDPRAATFTSGDEQQNAGHPTSAAWPQVWGLDKGMEKTNASSLSALFTSLLLIFAPPFTFFLIPLQYIHLNFMFYFPLVIKLAHAGLPRPRARNLRWTPNRAGLSPDPCGPRTRSTSAGIMW